MGFRVHRLMAEGSVAQVYEVANARTGRHFVLKCLDATDATEEQRARFHAGLKGLLDMRHEGLPAVLDGGCDEGKLWWVQELVAGRLAIKDEREPHWVKTCGWALPAAQALHAAAGKGFLHGDLSPDSIALSADGAMQVLGLGGHNLYGFGPRVVRATPEFRSPEQRAGLAIDARSDIYSFGLLLYASLSGEGRAPVRLRSYKEVPRCRRALAELLVMCIQRDPAKRIQTWKELENLLRMLALHQIMSRDVVSFSAPSPSSPPSPSSGVRGRDELEEAAGSGAVKPDDSGAEEALDSGAEEPVDSGAEEPVDSDAAVTPRNEGRDTLESVPHASVPERSGALTVIEVSPERLCAGLKDVSRAEVQEVEAAKGKPGPGEEVVREEKEELRHVAELPARREVRGHRGLAVFVGLAAGLALLFVGGSFFLVRERGRAPVLATSWDIPKVPLEEASVVEPVLPPREVAPSPREEASERSRSPVARRRLLTAGQLPAGLTGGQLPGGVALEEASEFEALRPEPPSPPAYVGNAVRLFAQPSGVRYGE